MFKMDTEEPQTENPLLMQTDEVDSDVSMATAQSGSAIPTDIEEMGSPCPASLDDVKLNKANDSTDVKVFVKLEDDEMSTPIATENPVPSTDVEFQAETISHETLLLLVECFYLPYEHGPIGKEMITKFKWLNDNAFRLSKIRDKKTETYLDKVGQSFKCFCTH